MLNTFSQKANKDEPESPEQKMGFGGQDSDAEDHESVEQVSDEEIIPDETEEIKEEEDPREVFSFNDEKEINSERSPQRNNSSIHFVENPDSLQNSLRDHPMKLHFVKKERSNSHDNSNTHKLNQMFENIVFKSQNLPFAKQDFS